MSARGADLTAPGARAAGGGSSRRKPHAGSSGGKQGGGPKVTRLVKGSRPVVKVSCCECNVGGRVWAQESGSHL